MSLIDDLLITIDDMPGITNEEILAICEKPADKKNAIFSALARLNAKGLIKQASSGLHLTESGKKD